MIGVAAAEEARAQARKVFTVGERNKVMCMCERGPCRWALVGNKPGVGDPEESEEEAASPSRYLALLIWPA